MFSRKQRFYEKKSFYAAVLTAFTLVMILNFWMNGDGEQGKELVSEQDPNQIHTVLDQQVSSPQVDTNIGQAGISGTIFTENQAEKGYLVVEEDRYIRIYQVDDSGNKILVRTTEILFDLLGTKDQELFRAGVHVNTDDELMELLQDFES